MSDHERGAYTPPHADAPLSFDPRQPVRGARPIPLTLILSVLVLAALVAAIFVFYQQGVRTAGQAPQTVGAPVGGLTAPAPAGSQPQDPAAGLQIYRSEAGGPMETVPAEPKFAPEPETPQARPTTPVIVAQAPPVASQAPTPANALRPAIPAAAPTPAKPPVPAPVVVAKGTDLLAARIREIAAENGVPLVAAPPLARALYRSVELGHEVPAALYATVAQVLTYVYQLKSAMSPAHPQRKAGRNEANST